MAAVLHIIERQTPTDMLDQLTLLAGEDDVVVSVGPPPQYVGFDLSVQAFHCPPGFPQLAGKRLRGLAESAELVHAWSPGAAAVGRWIPGRRRRGGVLSLPCPPTKRELRILHNLRRKCGFDLTVPTQAARASLLHAGFGESVVHLLPPPALLIEDTDRETRRKRMRLALGVRNGQSLLIVPERMIRETGHKYASWAHGILRQIRGDLLLWMPGGGPAEQRVKFFAATTGYDNEVFFTDDRFERRDVLAGGDIALFLNERDTGTAALAAAMGAGLPIVGSALPGFGELIPHEEAGLLVPRRDPRAASAAILRLIEDPQLIRRLATAARDRVRRYFEQSLSRRRLEEIYTTRGRPHPA